MVASLSLLDIERRSKQSNRAFCSNAIRNERLVLLIGYKRGREEE